MRSERPLYWVYPHKNEKELGEILHETEVMIYRVSIVDLDWAEVIGIA